jgi:hypothetical protein
MLFYCYEIRPNKRVTIHTAPCPHCRHGAGKRGTGPTDNGEWTEAFATMTAARAAVAGRQPLIRDCGTCRPDTA